MQTLSCFLHHHRDVVSPCELVRDEGSQECEVVNPLHRVPIYMQREGFLKSMISSFLVFAVLRVRLFSSPPEMSPTSVEQRTQHTALRGAGAESEGGGGVGAEFHCLGPVG